MKDAKKLEPDEVIDTGLFSVARFGKNIEWQSNLTEKGHAEFQKRCVELYPKVEKDINDFVAAIAELVSHLPPEQLLHRAWWEMAGRHFQIESEAEITTDDAHSLRMVDYIQSVIASVTPAQNQRSDITEDEWSQLKELVAGLFSTLNMTYQICRTAKRQAEDPEYDDDVEEFYYKAQMYWCNVCGARYQVHDEAYLQDVFRPHTAIFEELFGITAENFIQELMKIWEALTHGIQQSWEEMDSFRTDTLQAVEAKIEAGTADEAMSFKEILDQVIIENGWEERRDRATGRLIGLDLFDVNKVTDLPAALVEKLTWKAGEDTEFFSEGEFAGWPLRIWPISRRPFISLNGQTYCFHLHALFDNIYRVMEKVIRDLKPGYAETWKETQTALTEDLPLTYLNKILPGATAHKSAYYKWYPEQTAKKKEWCEVDGIFIYDDNLFIIECRGGAFTYTPPATDFSAYIASLKNLAQKPATQGTRFLDYLNSEEKVAIFDKSHKKLAELSKSNFRNITLCAVTLDPFTEVAAQVQHLRRIGVDVGSHPVWVTSVDDLRVYADIFTNPLHFLHYIEQRNEAFRSDIIRVDDELDHLGLYLEHNHYSTYASELKEKSDARINFHGFRSGIDKHFLEVLLDPSKPSPVKQDTPERLDEIISYLAAQNTSGRSKLASYLLDFDGFERNRLADTIENEIRLQPKRGRPIAHSTAGGNMLGYTMFCYTPACQPKQPGFALEHTKKAMVLSGDVSRLLLELEYSPEAELTSVDWTSVSTAILAPQELERLKSQAGRLREQRLAKAREIKRKIGRNDPCPCGSGKKYKRCCQN